MMPSRGMEALVTAIVCVSEVNCTLKVPFSPPEAELKTARNDCGGKQHKGMMTYVWYRIKQNSEELETEISIWTKSLEFNFCIKINTGIFCPVRFEAFNLTEATSEFSCCMRHKVSYDDFMPDIGFIETGMDIDGVWGTCSVKAQPDANTMGRALPL